MSRSQCVARDGAAPHTPSRDGDDGADGARDPRRRAARARDARGVGDARATTTDDATRRRASGAFERARRFEDARVDDARGRARGRREKDARTIDALERGRRGRRARTRRRGNGDRGRRARRLNARDGTASTKKRSRRLTTRGIEQVRTVVRAAAGEDLFSRGNFRPGATSGVFNEMANSRFGGRATTSTKIKAVRRCCAVG